MRLIPLQSSNVAAIAYQPGQSYFYAQFPNGAVYRYTISTEEQAAALLIEVIFNAESQGKAFNDLVKGGQYPYTKVDDVEGLDFHV